MMAYNSGYVYVSENSVHIQLKCGLCMKPFIAPVTTNCQGKNTDSVGTASNNISEASLHVRYASKTCLSKI